MAQQPGCVILPPLGFQLVTTLVVRVMLLLLIYFREGELLPSWGCAYYVQQALISDRVPMEDSIQLYTIYEVNTSVFMTKRAILTRTKSRVNNVVFSDP